ncbi:hypothetical protein EJ08DRAFT_735256 [Tothia fuscella]|uniref:Uncharacterized protein n=1 Tax=Tothia fuscella TaxID=1048955 RepID=A0A9P4NPQ4_9PEZI|nr:hypothetical protein EJ08DRAFT_735256 [Tothia fuscella]
MATTQQSYSRDEVVSEITSFYDFLVKMYLPENAVKYPPEGGWPMIKEGYLDPAKNATVLDLLKRIPYVDDNGMDYLIYPQTMCVDYTAFEGEGPHDADPLSEEQTVLPAHVVALAMIPGKASNGYWFFLDTQRGTITRYDFVDGPTSTDLSEEVEDDRENWLEYETYRVPEFFEMLKEDFRTLQVIPRSATEIGTVRRSKGYPLNDKMTEVYHAHGWPGEDFKKEECSKQIADLC